MNCSPNLKYLRRLSLLFSCLVSVLGEHGLWCIVLPMVHNVTMNFQVARRRKDFIALGTKQFVDVSAVEISRVLASETSVALATHMWSLVCCDSVVGEGETTCLGSNGLFFFFFQFIGKVDGSAFARRRCV
jgi:hypothetical protein